MVAPFKRQTGFGNQPKALRRCVLEILRRRDMLSAHDIAGVAYGTRLIVRPGWRRHVSAAQLVATRRALRNLEARGKVAVLYRRRRRKIYTLQESGR